MGVSEVGIELERPFGGFQPILAGIVGAEAKVRLAYRKESPGSSIFGIELQRLLAQADDEVSAPSPSAHPVATRHEVEAIGLRTGGSALGDGLAFGGCQADLQRRHDGPRNIVLHGEDVVEVAVVALGPQMLVG